MGGKSVLFLSGLDFKEKSIQVIRKTPEAYRDAGWKVFYIVGRDYSVKDNYFYEKIIDIEGIDVYRFAIPFCKIYDKISNPLIMSLLLRLRRYACTAILIYQGWKFLKKHQVDVVYGYEFLGGLAARFLNFFGVSRQAKIIFRFQGVLFVKGWLEKKQWYRWITEWDYLFALRTNSDLCIVTNDGSHGNEVLKRLHSKHLKKFLFLVNGVDDFKFEINTIPKFSLVFPVEIENKKVFISVARLHPAKGIDKCLKLIQLLVHDYKVEDLVYLIVGDGNDRKRLESLVKTLDISDHVFFLGAIEHRYVPALLYKSQYFLSMYASTNVGNPLLEAIRTNLLIVTLNNGDTSKWIQHDKTGLIYKVQNDACLTHTELNSIASDLYALIGDMEKQEAIKKELHGFANEHLWTWEQRFKTEIEAVDQLFDGK